MSKSRIKETHINCYNIYTAKTPSIFLEECLCETRLKHVLIIEDSDNVILIVTSIRKLLQTTKIRFAKEVFNKIGLW